jgi:hypothetical protein
MEADCVPVRYEFSICVQLALVLAFLQLVSFFVSPDIEFNVHSLAISFGSIANISNQVAK